MPLHDLPNSSSPANPDRRLGYAAPPVAVPYTTWENILAKAISVEDAKELVLARVAAGMKVVDAMKTVGRSYETWRDWRKSDPAFRARSIEIRKQLDAGTKVTSAVPDFPEFSERYLKNPLPIHQLRAWDVIEGREPRELHETMQFQLGNEGASQVILNFPPDHPLALDTPVLTVSGWKTQGALVEGDHVFGPDGQPRRVLWKSEILTDQRCLEVEFDTGERFTVGATHEWVVSNLAHKTFKMTTAALAADLHNNQGKCKWRVDVADSVELPDRDLPVEPYLLGYWLGDGCKNDARLTVGDEDLASLREQIPFECKSHRYSGANYLYVTGLVPNLRKADVLGNKHIPVDYLLASRSQRLALLQGLMDTDGSVQPKGRVYFHQKDRTLAEQVKTLAASLGFKPRLKAELVRATDPQGKRHEGIHHRVYFSPGDEVVFRLPRKAAKQVEHRGSGGQQGRRTIRAIRDVDPVPVQCIMVASDPDPEANLWADHQYLVGDGLIPTSNAKSTTWTMNWATWLIHCNPEVRIIVVSKTQRLAKQFLLGIKQRLTNPLYESMHAAFGPEGGWRGEKDDGLAWREDMIYVRGRDPGQKDPTVQALGIGGQIYGARADVIILDDCEDLTNYGSYEQHATWIAQEVNSRLTPESADDDGGRLVVVGTRVGPMDMYRFLREAKDLDEEPTWTYFAQPAILEGATNPNHEEWQVLWPERMTPRSIKKKRSAFANPRHFQLIYQQQDVLDNAVFRAEAVRASMNGQRYHGPMVHGATGHRHGGMSGLYVVGSWDPASSAGCNAMVVGGADRQTQKRWILDAWNRRGALPRDSIAKLKEFTEKYNVREWRIEKNAVQEFITQLDEVRTYLHTRGVRLTAHHTHTNKWDANKGVETLAPLFDSCVDEIDGRLIPRPKGQGLIELPSADHNSAIAELIQQLILWEPEQKRQIQDLVMALWFNELGMREHLHGGNGRLTHMPSRFTARGALKQQTVVRLDDLRNQGLINAV